MFVDSAFPADHTSLGMTAAEANSAGITWRRSSELFGNAPLLPTTVEPQAVVQGLKADCYLVAALSLLASRGTLLCADGTPLVRAGVPGQYIVCTHGAAQHAHRSAEKGGRQA